MDVDNILNEVGDYGRYQKFVLWFILLPGVLPCGFHAYNQLFMAATPDHHCIVNENQSIPREFYNGKIRYSRCHLYDKTNDNASMMTCNDGWYFVNTTYESTVVTEWNLVCERDYYTTLALVLFGASGLVGNCIFGYIQDGIGRKPAFFIFLFIQTVFGIATAVAWNFGTWLVFRLGVGFTVPAILGTPYVLAIELVGPKHRTTVTLLINVAYSLSLVLLSSIVWSIRNWRLLALLTTLPFCVLFLTIWNMPESPRWLMSQGRYREAEKIINKMAKMNGRKLSSQYLKMIREMISKEKKLKESTQIYGIKDLLRNPVLRWKTIIITFIWFTNTSVYVGLSYYAPALGGNEFLTFFLAGAVEFPTYLFLWPAIEKWGRSWTLCVSMTIGGTACLTTFLVQNDSVMTLCLYCVGKMGISSSFVVLPLMASELYPTVVRGLGISVSSMIGNLGPVVIPLVNYMGHDMLTLPLMIMGAMLIVGGCCSLLLPETLNQHLPQRLEDAESNGFDCFKQDDNESNESESI